MAIAKITDDQLREELRAGMTAADISRKYGLNVRTAQRRMYALGPRLGEIAPASQAAVTLPKVLFFDIETAPLLAYVWGCGKQYVGHKQLKDGNDSWGIICITYCWDDGQPAKTIDWGYEEQDTRKVVEEFDKIASTADIIIGKNSEYFDIPMINFQRLIQNLPGNPTWALATDDLQKQTKKYFRAPSQSLDYFSKKLGLGGKVKMEMQDWIDIVEKNENGRKAYDKMCFGYGSKDVEDTRTLWQYMSEHFDSKFNTARWANKRLICKHADCGSEDVVPVSEKVVGLTTYKVYNCNHCGRYAGKTVISSTTGKEGMIR